MWHTETMTNDYSIFIYCGLIVLATALYSAFFEETPNRQKQTSSVAQKALSKAVTKELQTWWPLKVGARRRYTIQSKSNGPGVVEQEVVEERKIDGKSAFRLRAVHKYEDGHMGIEELYVRFTGTDTVVPARLTSGGDYGTYTPPMVSMSAPVVLGTKWAGETEMNETARNGKVREAIDVPFQGHIAAIEAVSVPAGRFTSCARVENLIANKFTTREWFAKGIGVVRREVLLAGEVMVLQELVLAY